MDTFQIYDTLKSIHATKSMFIGVFPADKIPILPWGKGMICNTEPSYQGGQHWVAFYNTPTSETIEFFDPFGGSFFQYEHLRQMSTLRGHEFYYSHQQSQSDLTDICGAMCMYFIYYRALGKSYDDIVNVLNSEPDIRQKIKAFQSFIIWTT